MLDRNTAEDGGTVPRIRRRVFVIPTVVLIAITTVMVSPSATSGHTTSATSALPSRSAVGHHFADSVSDDLSAKPHQADASRSTHSPRLHHYTYHLTIPNGEGVCPVVPDTSFPSLCRASSSPAGSPSPQPHDSSQGSCLQSWESPPLCVDCPGPNHDQCVVGAAGIGDYECESYPWQGLLFEPFADCNGWVPSLETQYGCACPFPGSSEDWPLNRGPISFGAGGGCEGYYYVGLNQIVNVCDLKGDTCPSTCSVTVTIETSLTLPAIGDMSDYPSRFCQADSNGLYCQGLEPPVGSYPFAATVCVAGFTCVTTGAFTLNVVPSPPVYVGLGDSYSSGEGVHPFLPGTDVPQYLPGNMNGPIPTGNVYDLCHRSKFAYPELVGDQYSAQIGFYACSGARPNNVTQRDDVQYPGERDGPNLRPVVQTKRALVNSSTNLVTITIGGNELGWVGDMEHCLLAEINPLASTCQTDQSWQDSVSASITQVQYHLLNVTIPAIQVAAPNASILLVGYPQLFPPADSSNQYCDKLSYFTPSLQSLFNQYTTTFNKSLQADAEEDGVSFVDPQPTFSTHSICGTSGVDWLNGFVFNALNFITQNSGPVIAGSFHPNQPGQQGYAETINDFINSASNKTPYGFPVNPQPVPNVVNFLKKPRPHTVTVPTEAFDTLSSSPVGFAIPQGCDGAVWPGLRVTLTGIGYLPNSTIALTYTDASGPQSLGTAKSDGSGTLSVDITIPSATNGVAFPGASGGTAVFVDANGPGSAANTQDDIAMVDLASASVCPEASFSPSANSVPAGTPVSFTTFASNFPAGDELSYSWDFGDGAGTSTQQNPTYSFGSGGNYVVQMTVTDSDGIGPVTFAQQVSVTAGAISFVSSPDPATAGQTVTFTPSTTSFPPGDQLAYSWNFGDGAGASTQESPAYSYAAAGSYPVTLTVTDSEGLGPVTDTAIEEVSPVVSFSASLPTIPSGQSESFTPTVFGYPPGDALTYSWDFGDGSATSSSASPTHVYENPSADTATLTVSDANGLAPVTFSQTIEVSPPLSLDFSVGANLIFAGQPALFASQVVNYPLGDGLSYSWSFGDGTTDSTTGSAPEHIYHAPGAYTASLTVTDADGLTPETVSLVVTVLAAPVATITAIPSPAVVTEPVSFSATVANVPVSDSISYVWDFGDGAVATGQTPVHTFSQLGSYSVHLTVSDTQGYGPVSTTFNEVVEPPPCNDPTLYMPGEGPAPSAVPSGDAQTTPPSAGLSQPLAAYLYCADASGKLVLAPADEAVTFVVPQLFAIGPSGSFEGGESADQEFTNSDGLVTSLPLVANSVSGTWTVVAFVTGNGAIEAELPYVEFNSGCPQAGYSLEYADGSPQESGSNQVALPNSAFALPLSAQVIACVPGAVLPSTIGFATPPLVPGEPGGTIEGGTVQPNGGADIFQAPVVNGVATSGVIVADGYLGEWFALASEIGGGLALASDANGDLLPYALTNVATLPTGNVTVAVTGNDTPPLSLDGAIFAVSGPGLPAVSANPPPGSFAELDTTATGVAACPPEEPARVSCAAGSITGLRAGYPYILSEVTPPPGYQLPIPVAQSFVVAEGTTTTETFADTFIPGSATVTLTGNDDLFLPVSGAVFALTGPGLPKPSQGPPEPGTFAELNIDPAGGTVCPATEPDGVVCAQGGIGGLVPGQTYLFSQVVIPPGYSMPNPQSFAAPAMGVTTTVSFADLFLVGNITTDSGAQSCSLCILDPSASSALSAIGAATIGWAGILTVDSTSASAVSTTGSAIIDGHGAYLAGNARETGSAVFTTRPAVQTGSAVDPFSWFTLPVVTGSPQVISVSGSSTTTVSPGVYSTISVSGNAKLTLQPGYYVVTGGVSVSGSAVLDGTNVSIYLACSTYPRPCPTGSTGAGLTVTGSGQVGLSKGAIGPGAGFSILADSHNESAISATGSGTLAVTGFIEAAGASLRAVGHASVSVDGGGVVVDTASATGSAKIVVDKGTLGVP